jgi:arylsulfatase A-like enzyme
MNQSSRPWWSRFRQAWPPLGHPLAAATLVVFVVRFAGLRLHYFGRDLNGLPPLAPMFLFPAALAYHCAFLLSMSLGLLLAWKFLPRARRAVLWLGTAVFGLMILLGQVDFEMLRLVGRRFSPSVFFTYVPHAAVTAETILPLLADRGHTLVSLGLIAAGWLALAIVLGRALRAGAAVPRWSWAWLAVMAAGAGYLATVPPRWSSGHRALFQPPEMAFLRALAGADRLPAPDAARLAPLLRGSLVPAAGQAWRDEFLPLVHTPPAGPPPATKPDIIVIAVESLHALRLGFINPAQQAVTPEFDALARDSVLFPHFIASGYPSAPGIFALNTGVLPHRTRTLTAEFTDREFDAMPARLKDLGYRRTAIWGGNVAMANQLYWVRRWYDEVDYQFEGNGLDFHHNRGDAETFRVLMEHLTQADRAEPGRPQFIFVATAGTHGPFTAAQAVFSQPEDRAEAAPFMTETRDNRVENYDNMLRLLDRQIGRLRRFLATRPRARDTVLVICGDHGVHLSGNASADVLGFPFNGVVWTTALIYGDARLVGPPRVENFPASEVDVMPTVLALAGDRRPTAAMGADLLAPLPPEKRVAVAVREDGYRLDRGEWSLFVSAADPSDYFVRHSFSPDYLVHKSEPGGPFTARDARDLHAAVQAWSWLIEQNRVWSPAILPP